MDVPAFLAGMTMSLGLVAAIGAQNVFVLRQGLRNEHLLPVCLACAASDALLITLGVAGFARIAALLPWLDPAMRCGGAAFLTWYGARSLRSAIGGTGALAAGGPAETRSLPRTLLACAAITFLNPHVYLDTVVLLGAVASGFPEARPVFAAGAIAASFLFFFALGYGATRLRPLLARPLAWRTLEGIIALIMWMLAFRLIAG